MCYSTTYIHTYKEKCAGCRRRVESNRSRNILQKSELFPWSEQCRVKTSPLAITQKKMTPNINHFIVLNITTTKYYFYYYYKNNSYYYIQLAKKDLEEK